MAEREREDKNQKSSQRINRNTICNRRSLNLNCEKLESRRESHVFNLNPSLALLKAKLLIGNTVYKTKAM